MPNPNPPVQAAPEPARPPDPPCVARPVAPEDVRPGDYVAIMDADAQYFPQDECLEFADPPRWYARMAFIPDHAGRPRRVVEVGLPFIVVRYPNGDHGTLDLRLTRLFRLPHAYGEAATERLAPKRKKPEDKQRDKKADKPRGKRKK